MFPFSLTGNPAIPSHFSEFNILDTGKVDILLLYIIFYWIPFTLGLA